MNFLPPSPFLPLKSINKSICHNQFIWNLFHIHVIAKGGKMATHFTFLIAKRHILDLCAYLKILKILPGPIQVLNSVSCQTLSWPLISILWLPWRHRGESLYTRPTEAPDWPAWAMRLLNRTQILSGRTSKRRLSWLTSAPWQLQRTLLSCVLFPWMLHAAHSSETHPSGTRQVFPLHHPFHRLDCTNGTGGDVLKIM